MDDVDEDTMAAEVEELNEMLKNVLAEDPEPGEYDNLRIEDDIEPPADDAPVFSLGGPVDDADKLTGEQGRQELYERLDKWVREGKNSFAPRDVTDIYMKVNLADTKRWFYRERDRLIKDGVISEDESDEGFGLYDILRSPSPESTESNENRVRMVRSVAHRAHPSPPQVRGAHPARAPPNAYPYVPHARCATRLRAPYGR